MQDYVRILLIRCSFCGQQVELFVNNVSQGKQPVPPLGVVYVGKY